MTQKISIGIPTYNNPDGVRHTLECLKNQTYENLDILISDNSDNMETMDVIQECMKTDSRIRACHQKGNIGMNNNYLFVFDNTNEDYFIWMPDDDHCEPTYIEELWKGIENSSGKITSIICHMTAITADGEPIDRCEFIQDVIPEFHRYRIALYIAGRDTFAYYMRGLHKRSILKKYIDICARTKNVVGRDNTMFAEMVLSEDCCFGFVDKKLYVVNEPKKSNAVKYKGEREGNINRDVFGRLWFFIDLNSYLLMSKNIPVRRKWVLPFVFVRMGVRTAWFYCIRYPYVLSQVILGKRQVYQ
jgi:glycosyltransferase involved in cell wall biosynthesis